MEQHFWQILFWLLTTLVGILILIVSFFWKNFVKRIDENFNELFKMFDLMAKQHEYERLNDKVEQHTERIIKLESKVYNCKQCNL